MRKKKKEWVTYTISCEVGKLDGFIWALLAWVTGEIIYRGNDAWFIRTKGQKSHPN